MRDDATIGVDERDLDDATLVALADACATPPPPLLRARVLATARDGAGVARVASSERRWRLLGSVAAAAALALGGLAWRATRLVDVRTVELAALARTNAELSTRLDEQGRMLASLQASLAGQTRVLRVLAGPRTVTATLAPQGGGGGSGRVVVDAASGEGALVLADLAPPGSGRAYELWTIRGNRAPEPAGVFEVEPGRPLAARVAPLERPQEVTGFAVSIEPVAGSTSPTGPIVLAGSVAS